MVECLVLKSSSRKEIKKQSSYIKLDLAACWVLAKVGLQRGGRCKRGANCFSFLLDRRKAGRKGKRHATKPTSFCNQVGACVPQGRGDMRPFYYYMRLKGKVGAVRRRSYQPRLS